MSAVPDLLPLLDGPVPASPQLREGLRVALDHLDSAARALGVVAGEIADGRALADARAVAAEVAMLRMAMLPEVIIGGIMEQVAARFGVEPERIMSRRRDDLTVLARWTVMRVARNRGLSQAKIAAALRVDHSSVAHGLAQLEARLALGGGVA